MIIASLATYQERCNTVLDTIASIFSQVDLCFVYCNDNQSFKNLYDYRIYFNNLKLIKGENLQDCGKFFIPSMLSKSDRHYIFLCDDDIIYPSDYVIHAIDWIDHYRKKRIVCYHGKYFPGKINDYFADNSGGIIRFSFQRGYDFPAECTVPGTGVTAYHSSYFSCGTFQMAKMVDIEFALKAKQQKKKILMLPHPKDWIIQNSKAKNQSIFDEFVKKSDVLTKIVNEKLL